MKNSEGPLKVIPLTPLNLGTPLWILDKHYVAPETFVRFAIGHGCVCIPVNQEWMLV